jgi:hypothetical protein
MESLCLIINLLVWEKFREKFKKGIFIHMGKYKWEKSLENRTSLTGQSQN